MPLDSLESSAPSGDLAARMKGELEAEMKEAIVLIRNVKAEVHKAVFGQEDFVDKTIITILSGGHGLLIGVPGLAKTLAANAIAKAIGLDFERVQFTPDKMPADIIGSEFLEEFEEGGKKHKTLRFEEGPIFTQLLLGDEINRASPRTQAALLQGMQEGFVTIGRKNYRLPKPFHVLATQNPLDQEGTYPLPEAQLDRFMMQIDTAYPDRTTEERIMMEGDDDLLARVNPVLNAAKLMKIQALAKSLPVSQIVMDAILDLTRGLRDDQDEEKSPTRYFNQLVKFGPGPRAAIKLLRACKSRALLDGRLAPSCDDVAALADPVLKHRMAVRNSAKATGATVETLIQRALETYVPMSTEAKRLYAPKPYTLS